MHRKFLTVFDIMQSFGMCFSNVSRSFSSSLRQRLFCVDSAGLEPTDRSECTVWSTRRKETLLCMKWTCWLCCGLVSIRTSTHGHLRPPCAGLAFKVVFPTCETISLDELYWSYTSVLRLATHGLLALYYTHACQFMQYVPK